MMTSLSSIRRMIDSFAPRCTVVPFVGAGLSRQFGLPTWREFLLEETTRQTLRQTVESLLNAGKFEEAAELLLQERGAAFERAIENRFTQRSVLKPASAAMFCLTRISPGPVLTTNFDNVLEQVFAQAQRPFTQIIQGPDGCEMVDAFNEHRHHLIKVHGNARNPDTRILTLSEYEKHYCSPSSQINYRNPLPRGLRSLMSRATLLFLGCSLNHDRYLDILESVVTDTNNYHFALLEEPSVEPGETLSDLKDKRERELSRFNIIPIWYTHGSHGMIRDRLHDIAAEINSPPIPDICPLHPEPDASVACRIDIFLNEGEECDVLQLVSSELESIGSLARLSGSEFEQLVHGGFWHGRARIFSLKRSQGQVFLHTRPPTVRNGRYDTGENLLDRATFLDREYRPAGRDDHRCFYLSLANDDTIGLNITVFGICNKTLSIHIGD